MTETVNRQVVNNQKIAADRGAAAPTAIVVDDEPLARNRLTRLLNNEGVQVVASAENGQQAINVVGKVSADILFMDIQMPVMDGLEAVTAINEQYQHPPAIVFCTAYEEHAIPAFKTNAVAYLLKPVSAEDLRNAIMMASRVNRVQLASVAKVTEVPPTISVNLAGAIDKLTIDEFVSFRSLDKNVFAKTLGGVETMVNYTLKDLENVFADDVLRVHRSALVNKSMVRRLVRGSTGVATVVLADDSEFPVSRRHLTEVKQCFN